MTFPAILHPALGADGQAIAPPMPTRPLYDVATAFAGLPTVWQAVLWHRGSSTHQAAESTPLPAAPSRR